MTKFHKVRECVSIQFTRDFTIQTVNKIKVGVLIVGGGGGGGSEDC